MATKRKGKGRKPQKRQPTTKYVVNATFKMRSPAISKTAADKLAKSARLKGGTVTVKKV